MARSHAGPGRVVLSRGFVWPWGRPGRARLGSPLIQGDPQHFFDVILAGLIYKVCAAAVTVSGVVCSLGANFPQFTRQVDKIGGLLLTDRNDLHLT